MPEVHKVFIGGGGDDWFSHIVENYAAAYKTRNPNFTCVYLSWSADLKLMSLLKGMPQDADVTVVGHSYGADAAFSGIRWGSPVKTLISIDPVGRFRPSWTTIRSRCLTWLNVRAEPSAGSRSFDDTIAGIGGKYPAPPKAGEAGAPNYSFTVDATHGAFATMMNAVGGGVSGKSLLGGNSVS